MRRRLICKEILQRLDEIKELKILFDAQHLKKNIQESHKISKILDQKINELLRDVDSNQLWLRERVAKKLGCEWVGVFGKNGVAKASIDMSMSKNFLVRRDGRRVNKKLYYSIYDSDIKENLAKVMVAVNQSDSSSFLGFGQVVDLSTGEELLDYNNINDVKHACDIMKGGIVKVRKRPSNNFADHGVYFFDKSKKRLFSDEDYLDSDMDFGDNGFIWIEKTRGEYYLLNQDGEEKYLGHFLRVRTLGEVYRVETQDRVSIIDQDREILIPSLLFDTSDPRMDYRRVTLPDGENCMDKKGNLILPENYEAFGSICEGLVWVKENGEWKVVTPDGNLVFKDPIGIKITENPHQQGGDYPRFSEGLCCVKGKEHGSEVTYYLDKKGNIVFSGFFELASDFRGGVAVLQGKGKNGWKYLYDKEGEKFAGPFENVMCENIRNPLLAAITPDHKFVLISREKKSIVAGPFLEGYGDFFGGFMGVRKDDDLWYLINGSGQIVSKEGYESLNAMSYGVAKATKNGETFYINGKGERVF